MGTGQELTQMSELAENSKTSTITIFHMFRKLRSNMEDIKKDLSQICRDENTVHEMKTILSGNNDRLNVVESFISEFENIGIETIQNVKSTNEQQGNFEQPNIQVIKVSRSEGEREGQENYLKK